MPDGHGPGPPRRSGSPRLPPLRSPPRHLAGEIDRRRLAAQVEADGPDTEQTLERRREEVLPRVLLHVIEPPGPVDDPMYPVLYPEGLTPCRRDDVDDAAILLLATSTTRCGPRVPVSNGCPPDVG